MARHNTTCKTIPYLNLFYQKLISLSMAFSDDLYPFHYLAVHYIRDRNVPSIGLWCIRFMVYSVYGIYGSTDYIQPNR